MSHARQLPDVDDTSAKTGGASGRVINIISCEVIPQFEHKIGSNNILKLEDIRLQHTLKGDLIGTSLAAIYL
jgi:hypothetical protein